MYYPVGWPRVLDGRGATGGTPLQLIRHRTKNLIFELRGHSVAVWHSRVSLKEVKNYIEMSKPVNYS